MSRIRSPSVTAAFEASECRECHPAEARIGRGAEASSTTSRVPLAHGCESKVPGRAECRRSFRDGKVIRWRVYTSESEALAAVGLRE
jgi:hypothetical protein